ncbi:gliding motility-associated C-terminal domain-containing protein [Chitinophaga rhizophila]|uniref:Gliding motility-associated C-terminal domain-containing protein n=1 Tax=Chitinophaga rhizophila TaxID=2866212 RepID=A0ABS7GL03_9BACT|nr:gliding motility-associated C-terminal domain-containing protein [Chitinophaga rhizophila]MBW8687103.1 gliding motility-associated C-terminal domain-containing protein [Chitinophaga rhizophila]
MKPTGVKLLLLTLSLLCVFSSSWAAVFTVTSHNDSGPGSLRDAITKANSNGTTERDYIYFNFNVPFGGIPEIILINELPALTSNIVIDASTQASPVFGVSTARVWITRANTEATYTALKIENANNVEIYGLCITTGAIRGESYGIQLIGNCNNIVIGGTGKGNVIYGFKYGIYGVSPNHDPKVISNLTIQSNLIGIPVRGVLSADSSCYQPILVTHLNGVTLGGNRTDLGNVIVGMEYGAYLSADAGDVTVAFNKIGTSFSGTEGTASAQLKEAYLSIAGSTNSLITVTDNLVAGRSIYGIGLYGIRNGTFSIQRNKIGTEVTGSAVLGQRSSGILISDCGRGTIGGSMADKNIIAGSYDVPVAIVSSHQVTVSQNEMFCNNTNTTQTGPANSISLMNWNPADGRQKPFVHVLTCNATTITGKATPNAKMEAFVPHRCGDARKCDGRNYIETFFAGADGAWTYALKGRSGVIFSATDAGGATSDYSNPVWSEDITDQIIHTACGKSTGSIINKVLFNATPFHWEDDNGNTVGTDTSLQNVPAGRYRLVMYAAGCNSPECIQYSPYYTIEDRTPLIQAATGTVRPATCGLYNGSVTGLQISGINLRFSWYNALAPATVIGIAPDIRDLAPGSYYLVVTDTVNTCSVVGGPYEISAINAPVLDASAAQVQNAVCSQPTGSVTGLRVTGTGVITYAWTNAGGDITGSTPDLTNVPGGTYTLAFSDQSGCPAAPSQPFVITSPGEIFINRTSLTIREAACTVDDGSITGLQATNAEIIRWVDTNGLLLGSGLDLTNRAPGNYRLEITNTYGCNATQDFVIPIHQPELITVSAVNTQNPVCNLNNGSVTGMTFSGGTPVSYRWLDGADAEVSAVKDLYNARDGIYRLYVKDAEQCEQLVTTIILKTPNLPVIDEAFVSILDDICSTTTGLIAGLAVNGKEPMSYEWLNPDSAVISTTLRAERLRGGFDYTLRVTDGYGCIVYSDPFTIDAVDILLLAPPVKDIVIMDGMSAQVKVANPLQGNYTLFRQGTDWKETNTTGEFTLTGITTTTTFGINYQFGECISPTTYFKIDVVDAIKVYAPTAFSPNGDGQNDIFKPRGVGVASYTLFTVMDRWGNSVFSTKSINAGWDGTFNGKKVPSGGYVWLIQGIDILGQPIQQKGAVLVVY